MPNFTFVDAEMVGLPIKFTVHLCLSLSVETCLGGRATESRQIFHGGRATGHVFFPLVTTSSGASKCGLQNGALVDHFGLSDTYFPHLTEYISKTASHSVVLTLPCAYLVRPYLEVNPHDKA